MKRLEMVYREILYQAIEKNAPKLTQAELARKLAFSLSTVNKAVQNLAALGAVDVHRRDFHVVDVKKILYYWASIRNLKKDIIYQTRVESPIIELEKTMPNNIVFAGYTAYKYLFKDVPADYSEIYVYGDQSLQERFPETIGTPNLFVLKKDELTERYGKKTTIAQTFVDVWNLKEWYAKEFVKAMEERLNGILEQ